MGFTKLDEGIVHSSIWSEAYSTRILWVTMLAMSDNKGFVASSRSGLVRAANITEAEFDVSITILESPDPDSRSAEFAGRRVKKVDGGWLILNYEKYRNFTYSSSPEAIRQRRFRDRQRDTSLRVTKGRDISASASASASEDKNKGVASFDEFWTLYPRKVEKKVALKAYLQVLKSGATPDALLQAVKGYLQQIERDGTAVKFIKHPATFLHEDRWRDYLPQPEETPEEYRARHDAEMKRLQAEGK